MPVIPACSEKFCGCDEKPDYCDAASNGDPCLCDNDCYGCHCADGDPNHCAEDALGNPCLCDEGARRR